MPRPRRTVGVLVLLDVYEVAIQVRDQDCQRRSVRVVPVPGALDRVGCIQTRINDREVRLLPRRGQFIRPRLAEKQVPVDLLFGQHRDHLA